MQCVEVIVNKLIENGKVAVVYSPGFGAGWSTWNTESPEIIYDPTIVKYVETERLDELKVYMELKYPGLYTGGIEDLAVEWIPIGTHFKINEYDGSESIEYRDSENWLIA
jgi:hypothetical protein